MIRKTFKIATLVGGGFCLGWLSGGYVASTVFQVAVSKCSPDAQAQIKREVRNLVN